MALFFVGVYFIGVIISIALLRMTLLIGEEIDLKSFWPKSIFASLVWPFYFIKCINKISKK